jgi:hypothetical protein
MEEAKTTSKAEKEKAASGKPGKYQRSVLYLDPARALEAGASASFFLRLD